MSSIIPSSSSSSSTSTSTSPSTSTSTSPSSSVPTSRSLYGGSLFLSLPSRFEDISQFRTVPDHQEVFADADTDQSLIIEINQYESSLQDQDYEGITRHYFEDYAQVNEAIQSKILISRSLDTLQLPQLQPFPSSVSFVLGEQWISKYKEDHSTANVIHVLMTIIRLKEEESDILIILNVPTQFGTGSSSEGRRIMDSKENEKVMEEVLKSFRIVDYSLFNGNSHNETEEMETEGES